MTHCTPGGFESNTGYGLNSDPYYWYYLLQQHGETLKHLRLLLAHSGGSQAWFDEDLDNSTFLPGDENWMPGEPYGEKVVKLCMMYKNVHCDFLYLAGILDHQNYDILKQRLEYLFNFNEV